MPFVLDYIWFQHVKGIFTPWHLFNAVKYVKAHLHVQMNIWQLIFIFH